MTIVSHQMRRFIRFLLLMVSSALLIVACQVPSVEQPTAQEPSSTASDCRIVKHEMGETEVCGQPQKVAALSPHILNSILSLGVQPVAYADTISFNFQRFDRPKEQIRYLGRYVTTQPINLGTRHNPSLERLAKIKPDLILAEDWQIEGQYDLFSRIAPTLLFSDDGPNGSHWRYDIEGIAKALGQEARAKDLLTRYPDQIAAARDQLASVVAAYPRVLVIESDNLLSTIYLDWKGTAARLLEKVGFEIVSPQNSPHIPGGDLSEGHSQISIEILPQIEADLIFMLAWSNDNPKDPLKKVKQQWTTNPLLNQVPASKNDHVFFVDSYLWNSAPHGPIADELILEQLPEILLPLIDEGKA